MHQWYKNKFYFFGRYGSSSDGSAFGVTGANENIEPDSSFGNNGKARDPVDGGRDEIYMVEPVSTGGVLLIAASIAAAPFCVLPTMGHWINVSGNNGMVFPDDSFSVRRMKVDKNNRLLLFCWHPGSEQYTDVAMVVKRLLENGRTDSSFGNNGILLIQNIKPEKNFSFQEALIQQY